MAFTYPLVYALASLLMSSQQVADQIRAEENEKLLTCLELIETDAEEAYEMSLAWLYEGNRPGARECKATSMIALGYFEDGALQLEALANAPDGGSVEDRAHFLARAGNAWLQAGLPDEAIIALDNAILLNSENYDLYTYRAQAYISQGEYEKAETDLNRAIASQPGDFNMYVYRAQARLGLDRFDEALMDIDQARTIDPENIDVLVLRGDIREAKRLSENR